MRFVIARDLADTHPLAFRGSVNTQKLFGFCRLHYDSQFQHMKLSHFSAITGTLPKATDSFLSFCATELRQVTGDLWLLEGWDLNLKRA